MPMREQRNVPITPLDVHDPVVGFGVRVVHCADCEPASVVVPPAFGSVLTRSTWVALGRGTPYVVASGSSQASVGRLLWRPVEISPRMDAAPIVTRVRREHGALLWRTPMVAMRPSPFSMFPIWPQPRRRCACVVGSRVVERYTTSLIPERVLHRRRISWL